MKLKLGGFFLLDSKSILMKSKQKNSKKFYFNKMKIYSSRNLNKKMKKIELLKEAIIEWSSRTSIHGIPNIFQNKNNLMKIPSLILTLSSLSVCIFLIIRSVNGFLEFQANSKIRVYSEPFVEYPAVTICFNNPERILDKSIDLNTRLSQNSLSRKPVFTENTSSPLSFSKHIILCKFGFRDCDQNDFIEVYDKAQGKCLKFNSGMYNNGSIVAKPKDIIYYGSKTGLLMEIYSSALDNAGVYDIYINNRSVSSSYLDNIEILRGFQNNIAISRTFSELLPYPHSNCVAMEDFNKIDNHLFNIMKNHNFFYSQKHCILFCEEDNLIQDCNCSSGVVIQTSKPSCDSEAQSLCGLKSGKKSKIECFNKCPIECSSVSYDLRNSISEYPSEHHLETIKEWLVKMGHHTQAEITNVDDNQLRKRLFSINVFYDNLKYTHISEIPNQTFGDLVADIGGTLGLFLGMSLLSFIDLYEIMFKILNIIAKNSK